jgi:hypothetical protein
VASETVVAVVRKEDMSELKHSESISELVKALAAARREFSPVKKEQINPFYAKKDATGKIIGGKYADLSALIEATEPALSKHGLVVIQSPHMEGTELVMTTMLVHESGQWFRGELKMPPTKPDAQSVGSVCTYARRYPYGSFLNVAAENDDDGNAAVGKEPKEITMPKPPAKKPALFPELPKEESFSVKFWRKAKAAHKTEIAVREYIGSLGYESTGEIPPTKHQEALNWADGVGA